MAVGHKWLSVNVYLNSSLSAFSNYTQLSTVIVGYSELSGKPLLVQPQCDLQVSGNKVWFGEGILELPGQQKLEALWDGRGRRAAHSWEREHAAGTWPVFCQECQPDMVLPRTEDLRGKSNFRAERGSKGSPNITMYLFPASECRKGKWEDDWTEGICSTGRACFGVWKAKTMITFSWRLKMWFRNGKICQTEAEDRSKYVV